MNEIRFSDRATPDQAELDSARVTFVEMMTAVGRDLLVSLRHVDDNASDLDENTLLDIAVHGGAIELIVPMPHVCDQIASSTKILNNYDRDRLSLRNALILCLNTFTALRDSFYFVYEDASDDFDSTGRQTCLGFHEMLTEILDLQPEEMSDYDDSQLLPASNSITPESTTDEIVAVDPTRTATAEALLSSACSFVLSLFPWAAQNDLVSCMKKIDPIVRRLQTNGAARIEELGFILQRPNDDVEYPVKRYVIDFLGDHRIQFVSQLGEITQQWITGQSSAATMLRQIHSAMIQADELGADDWNSLYSGLIEMRITVDGYRMNERRFGSFRDECERRLHSELTQFYQAATNCV